jgi:hypothetical protein
MTGPSRPFHLVDASDADAPTNPVDGDSVPARWNSKTLPIQRNFLLSDGIIEIRASDWCQQNSKGDTE